MTVATNDSLAHTGKRLSEKAMSIRYAVKLTVPPHPTLPTTNPATLPPPPTQPPSRLSLAGVHATGSRRRAARLTNPLTSGAAGAENTSAHNRRAAQSPHPTQPLPTPPLPAQYFFFSRLKYAFTPPETSRRVWAERVQRGGGG